jgi:hypothetical protein
MINEALFCLDIIYRLLLQHTGGWLPRGLADQSEVCSADDGTTFKCVWSTRDSIQEQADLLLFYAGVARKCHQDGPVTGSQG